MTFRCNGKIFNPDNSIPDFNELNWTKLLEIDKNNANLSFSKYTKYLRNNNAPSKKFNKQELKFQLKL